MLKTVVEALDDVPEALKPFYAEDAGKFILQIDGVDTHPQVASLKNAYERVKADKASEATKAKTLEAQLAEMAKGKPDEAQLMAIRKALEEERDAAKSEAAELRGKLTGVTRDRALADALGAAGITNPTYLKAAQALLGGQVKMDGDKAVIETDMGPMALTDHVKRWVAGEGKDFVSPPKGGGAKGNDGKTAVNQIQRAEFDQLSQVDRIAFAKAGGTVI